MFSIIGLFFFIVVFVVVTEVSEFPSPPPDLLAPLPAPPRLKVEEFGVVDFALTLPCFNEERSEFNPARSLSMVFVLAFGASLLGVGELSLSESLSPSSAL